MATDAFPFCPKCSRLYCRLICLPCGDCGRSAARCSCVKVSSCLEFCRLFEYKGETARSIIYCLKRRASHIDYRFIAKRLSERIKALSGQGVGFDCVCYVPRNKKGLARYGYDHARLLAEGLGALFDVPCKKLILHSGIKGEQKRLSREYRGFAVKTRFNINERGLSCGKLPYRRVLLADDIVTTGTTMGECAHILKSCGVKQVFGVAVAHTPTFIKIKPKCRR